MGRCRGQNSSYKVDGTRRNNLVKEKATDRVDGSDDAGIRHWLEIDHKVDTYLEAHRTSDC